MKNATVQRNIPSPAAFKEFLKSDDSLLSWNVSECETYCLANVLGVAIHQLTYNLAGVAGRPEQRCKWDLLEPHQVALNVPKVLTGFPYILTHHIIKSNSRVWFIRTSLCGTRSPSMCFMRTRLSSPGLSRPTSRLLLNNILEDMLRCLCLKYFELCLNKEGTTFFQIICNLIYLS